MEDLGKDGLAISQELTEDAQRKLEVIQTLLEPCDRATYGERLREGARKLGLSIRSVQRMFKRYQEDGIGADLGMFIVNVGADYLFRRCD